MLDEIYNDSWSAIHKTEFKQGQLVCPFNSHLVKVEKDGSWNFWEKDQLGMFLNYECNNSIVRVLVGVTIITSFVGNIKLAEQ